MSVPEEKEGKARFGISMSPNVFDEIEKRRGLIPRAPYIEHCLKQYFEYQDGIKEFFDDLLKRLPEKTAQEDCDKLRTIVEKARAIILEKKRSILPKTSL